MKPKDKTYKATVRINGNKLEDFIMTGKNSLFVKDKLISFFMNVMPECKTIEVRIKRVEYIDGDYIEIN